MKLVSINAGRKHTRVYGDKLQITGIYKSPIQGPVHITSLGITGDFIGSPKHHGGPDQAVYVYGGADYAWWQKKLGREMMPGMFGDNLTMGDLESAEFNVGDRLMLGEVILEVTAPRVPCSTLARRMGDPQFVTKFRDAERPGLYCRVIAEGMSEAGVDATIQRSAGEAVGIIEIFRDWYEEDKDESTLRRFLNAPIAIRTRRTLERHLERLEVEK